ncbi:MAG: hypothetical protein ACXVCY_11170 [Pseudobdellovibrionaceae bacterium]
MHKLVFTFFVLLLCSIISAQAKTLCDVPTKNSHLAIDQRDDVRLKCLRQKKHELKVPQCLAIAKSMEYSTNAEETRQFCLNNLRVSLNDCIEISNSMEYPDSGDDVRWDCLTRFNKIISQKQCKKLAKSMSYPANTQRANLYCSEELR